MILMRTLRNDYAKYAREEDDLDSLERDVAEESGWKLVHGDVFRAPSNLVLLAAFVGTGSQLAFLVLSVIFCAIIGMLYFSRGAIVTAFIVCYALTSFIGGYVSGGFYRFGCYSGFETRLIAFRLSSKAIDLALK